MTEKSLQIRPESEHVNFGRDLKELWRYRQLIKALVVRDIRIRYRGSSFGLVWSLINPLLQIFVTTIAVSFFLGAGPKNLSAYLMCAFLPWSYFQTVLLDASAIVNNYTAIMKKVYFPREIPVITICFSNGIQLLAATAIFIVYRWGITAGIYGWPGLPPLAILWLPFIMVLTFMFTLGTALIVTAYSFFYEDVRVLLIFWLNGVYYLLPILYFSENIRHSARLSHHWRTLFYHLYLLNPLAWIITAYKQIFFGVVIISDPGAHVGYLSDSFNLTYLAINTISVCAVLAIGYYMYGKLKWKFSERP